jgi:HEAT repeat protein
LQKTDFRTKFLLLKPAAALSKTHAPAREYLSQALLGDKDPHIRLGAASAVASVPSFSNELMGATRDSSVRVRQAAVIALGKKRVKNAEPMFVERLRSDKWPMVRSVAAEALGELGASPTADAALGAALADAAPMVRARVVEALGRRNVHKFAGALRGHLGDKKEDPQVRRAAALALGRLCDVASLDLLTELSVKRSDPMLDQSQRGLALAALEALAALGPSDLRDRLAPLLSAEAAPGAREAAERALARAPRCAKR